MSNMKFPVDVDMKLNISLGDDTEKTITRINEFSSKMAELIKLTQTGAATTGKLGDVFLNVGGNMQNMTEIAEKQIEAMGLSGKKAKDVNAQAKLLSAGSRLLSAQIKAENAQTLLAAKGLNDFDDSLRQLKADPTTANLEKASRMFDSFSTGTGGAAVALDRLKRTFSRAGPLLSQDFMGTVGEKFGGDTSKIIGYVNQLDQALGGTSGQAQFLKQVLSDPSMADNFIASISKSNLEMYKLSLANQMAIGSIGALKMAYMDLGRTFFWTGLGTMFALMSFQRMGRAGIQIEAAELGLTKSLRSEYEAQQKVIKLRNAGVTSGSKYANAQQDATEATLSRRLAEDRLRESITNQTLAQLQFVFGTLPTVIRTTVDLYVGTMKLYMARKLDTAATADNSGAEGTNTLAKIGTSGATAGLTAVTWQATIAVAALTAGITLGTSALAMMWAEAKATESIQKANDEFAKLKKTLTVRHSPALYEAFPLMANGMNKANYSMRVLGNTLNTTSGEFSNLRRIQYSAAEGFNEMTAAASQYTDVARTLMEPISRKPSALILPKQGMGFFERIAPNKIQESPTRLEGIMGSAGMNLNAPIKPSSGLNIEQNPLSKGIGNITVNITGPVTVRDDRDLDKMGQKIVSSIYRRGSGGGNR